MTKKPWNCIITQNRHLLCVSYSFWSCGTAITLGNSTTRRESRMNVNKVASQCQNKVQSFRSHAGTTGNSSRKNSDFSDLYQELHCLQSRFSEECPHLLVNEYFNSEMRQVTDTPTVLDCAINFVEAADETLKSRL